MQIKEEERRKKMLPSCFSPTSLIEIYLRRSFFASGLFPQTVTIDDGVGDETTLHFWGPNSSKPPNSKTLNRPSLVLIHGFGPSSLWQWRYQVSHLSKYYNIYAPDLIFFGKSTTKSPDRSEGFQAASIGKLMEKLGVERFSVMGTSYGGFVAYRMAVMWPERVEKVVIASSALNMKKGDNKDLVENRANVETIEMLMLPESAHQLRNLMGLAMVKKPFDKIPDFFLNDFVKQLYSENRKEKMELLKGMTIGHLEIPDISPLQQEVLIVWGENDQIFLINRAIELRKILGDKARLEVIKNTSHVPQIEQPAQFNQIVQDFLSS